MPKSIPDTIKKGKIVLKRGIDNKFFNLLFNLYKPFLSRGHLKDKYQYSIFFENNLIGFIQIGSKPNSFVQTALVPMIRGGGKNLGKEVKFILLDKLAINKLGFSSNKINYPSLKSFYDLGGGVFDSSLDIKRKKVEGFYRKKDQNKKMGENLRQLLAVAKKNYPVWLKVYKSRKKELKNLEVYLKIYNVESN